MARYLYFSLLCPALIATTACGVKKETHAKVLDELSTCQSDLSTSQKVRDTQGTRLEQLEAELSSTRAERDKKTKAEREKEARIVKLIADMKATEEDLKNLQAQRDAALARQKAFEDLTKKFRDLFKTGGMSIVIRKGRITLKLPSEILFASGRAKLSRAGSESLKQALALLIAYKDRQFLVAGHTDNVRIRSRRFRNNWHLSTARALSVLQFMVAAGFPEKNLGAAGYGEHDPVADNSSKEGKQQNRRIEIVLVPDLSQLPTLKAP